MTSLYILKLCLVHVQLFALMLVACSSSLNETEAFIGVISSSNLLIQPPLGGFVSIVNFTELSSALVRVAAAHESELSSALVQVMRTEAELNTTKSDLSSTKSVLSSALVRMNNTDELIYSALSTLSSTLNRISALESSTAVPSPCKDLMRHSLMVIPHSFLFNAC